MTRPLPRERIDRPTMSVRGVDCEDIKNANDRIWFRRGFYAALDQIEETGLQPTAFSTRYAFCNRAMRKWWRR